LRQTPYWQWIPGSGSVGVGIIKKREKKHD